MKVTQKYYNKVYKETLKLTKKLFGKTINDCIAEKSELKEYFEDLFKLPIDEINSSVMQENRSRLITTGNEAAFFKWAKYKTLSKILETLESACVLNTLVIKEYEHEC